jgi:hypothetical protein
MARLLAPCVLVALVAGAAALDMAASTRGMAGRERAGSLLQTWSSSLAEEKDTPVQRVVGLLKEMMATLQKDADEDEALYHKLACWCNNGEYEKSEFIEATQAKIAELESTIESLTAKSAELATTIKETEEQVAADKSALAEATAQREKQIQEFHGAELDSIQAVEQLKAALTVLAKHHGANAATPWMQSPAGSSLLELEASSSRKGKDAPSFTATFEARRASRSLDAFMSDHNMGDASAPRLAQSKFLQQGTSDEAAASTAESSAAGSWSAEDSAVVRVALRTASSFMQSKHGQGYYPSYSAQSGEIVGILKQLKEEMEADLAEAQKEETASAKAFEELRTAKTAAIETGEAMAEKKEDEKATTDNDLAEAKEDLGQETTALNEAQEFLKNMKETCAEADKNYEARKASRLDEMKAVTETITILTEDEARDAMAGTYSFVQLSSRRHRVSMKSLKRQAAAKVLRLAASKSNNPALSMLATSVELDAFTKVKKAIDDMIATLKTQQEDEVKKNDWCKAEIQENEMSTAKAEDLKSDQEAKIAELAEHIKALETRIAEAKSEIKELQTELQRATETRVQANLEYQKTVADQTVTIAVLKKALDRLATYYDSAGFLQRRRQTPPVPQMEYKANEGSTGVMQMIEKLIYEAKELMADSKASESEAQTAYETTIAETNASVAALQAEVVSKTKAKAETIEEKLQTESDLADTVKELEGLAKYNADLHGECDYILKNFMLRQEKRADEIEALQQAKQILSGASLS